MRQCTLELIAYRTYGTYTHQSLVHVVCGSLQREMLAPAGALRPPLLAADTAA
jgi:hypothetical protein